MFYTHLRSDKKVEHNQRHLFVVVLCMCDLVTHRICQMSVRVCGHIKIYQFDSNYDFDNIKLCLKIWIHKTRSHKC